jgi:HCOMODA/2-hydroxy-3-carboxy-muconic semialdehyde decarboxylase
MNALDELRRLLVLASRILCRHQVLDGFGHVSARHPSMNDRFLLSRRVAPGLVTERDICEFTLEGELASEGSAPVFLERFIHSSIYAARPDVQAVVHSHSPAIVALGVVADFQLRAVCHTCGFLGDGVPNFDIRDVAGDATDLLIRDAALGEALTQALGSATVVLMRGHGSTTVGNSVPEAVYRAIYCETNARIQSAATQLGPVTWLTAAEANAAEATSDAQVERNWDLWVRQLEG